MKQSEAIEILTTEEAVERLLARGYRRVPCVACTGLGYVPQNADPELVPLPGTTFVANRVCEVCGGNRVTWEAPSK